MLVRQIMAMGMMVPAILAMGQPVGPSATSERAFRARLWQVDDGMPQNSVRDLAQTRDGYVWVGTLHNGLARFDGVRFTGFAPGSHPQLDHPGIRRLLPDALDRLWVITYTPSLVLWHSNRFEFIGGLDDVPDWLLMAGTNHMVASTADRRLLRVTREDEGGWRQHWLTPPTENPVQQYAVYDQGKIAFRRADGSLGRVQDERFTVWGDTPGLPGTRVNYLVTDDQDRLWVGTDQAVAWWDGQRFHACNPTNGEPILNVTRIIHADHNRRWIVANGRWRFCEGWNWVAEARVPPGREAPWTRLRIGVRSDPQGRIWFLTTDAGLVHLDTDGTLSWPGLADALAGPAMRTLMVDTDGNAWTGNDRSGLVRVSPRLLEPVGRAQGLRDSLISSVSATPDGSVWMGTANGTVARWHHGVCTNFTLPGSVTSDTALVCGDQAGRVWVAAHGEGLFLWEEGSFRRVLSAEEVGAPPRFLLADSAGRLWMGSYDGLFVYEAQRLRQLMEVRAPSDYPGCVAEDASGTIWVGTFDGRLLQWTEAGWVPHRRPASPGYLRFTALLADPEGGLWIGTMDGGLLLFRDRRFHALTARQGLPPDTIWQIQLDDRGYLWLGTRVGLVRIHRTELEACARGDLPSVRTRIFGRDDGLPAGVSTMEFHPNACRAADGRLWFGTGDGIAGLDPGAVRSAAGAPRVWLDQVRVNGQPQDWLGAQPLRAGPGRTTLEFNFTGLSFMAPERIRFRYQLEGLDADWVDAESSRTAVYRHVPPGSYRFRVTACNSDGVWSSSDALLSVLVRPHFYERAWFRVSGGIGTLALGGFLVLAVTRRRVRRKLERLERQRALDRERARIAQDLHDDLGAGLTEIGLTSELVQDPLVPPEESRSYAAEIATRARELVAALDEIVWAVNPRNDTVRATAAYFCQFAQHLLKPAGIRCRLEVDKDLPEATLSSDQRHHLFLAFKEACHNVVQHARATEVRLSIRADAGMLEVALADNGQGMASGVAPAGEGHDGLLNMQSRMIHLEGTFAVEAEAPQGTRVTLRLPLHTGSQAGSAGT